MSKTQQHANDGNAPRVLKNFASVSEVADLVAPAAAIAGARQLEQFWTLEYVLLEPKQLSVIYNGLGAIDVHAWAKFNSLLTFRSSGPSSRPLSSNLRRHVSSRAIRRGRFAIPRLVAAKS